MHHWSKWTLQTIWLSSLLYVGIFFNILNARCLCLNYLIKWKYSIVEFACVKVIALKLWCTCSRPAWYSLGNICVVAKCHVSNQFKVNNAITVNYQTFTCKIWEKQNMHVQEKSDRSYLENIALWCQMAGKSTLRNRPSMLHIFFVYFASKHISFPDVRSFDIIELPSHFWLLHSGPDGTGIWTFFRVVPNMCLVHLLYMTLLVSLQLTL